MKSLEDIKIGDNVTLHQKHCYDVVRKVERLTNNYIIVDGRKFRKKDGYEPGNYFRPDYITTL